MVYYLCHRSERNPVREIGVFTVWKGEIKEERKVINGKQPIKQMVNSIKPNLKKKKYQLFEQEEAVQPGFGSAHF